MDLFIEDSPFLTENDKPWNGPRLPRLELSYFMTESDIFCCIFREKYFNMEAFIHNPQVNF